MRQSRQKSTAPGWFPVEPVAATSAGSSIGSRGRAADPLGLSRPSNPLRFLAHKPPASHNTPPVHLGGNQSRALGTPPANKDGGLRCTPSQRHRKLVGAVRSGGNAVGNLAEAFSPLRSLRLASIPAQPSTTIPDDAADQHLLLPLVKQQDRELTPWVDSAGGGMAKQSRGRLRRLDKREPSPLPPPLHELIQTVTEGIFDHDDPLLQINRASVVQLFMEQWQRQFDANAANFKSIAVRYEVGYRELQQMTANLPIPNELLTAFSCKMLDDLTPHFGAFAQIMRVAAAEARQSIYFKPDEGRVPYFALVQYQKRQLAVLVRDRDGRERRNAFLSHEIEHVLATFRHFLDECARGLLRTSIREWHSVAIVRKKNSKKYIEYFSAWFSSSVKTLVPRIFTVWKRQAAQRKLHVAKTQLGQDASELSELQRQVDEAAAQRDVAQLELHAVRNDRKQLEDLVQRLTRKIQSANAFLETSQRREPLVANEGHLRIEAVSFLPPLVLESLLRGYHGLGFLQHRCERAESISANNDVTGQGVGWSDLAARYNSMSTSGASAGLFIRQVFAQIIDIQSQTAGCDTSVSAAYRDGDPPSSLPSTAVNTDITDSFSRAFCNIQHQIRSASATASAPVAKVLFANAHSLAHDVKPASSPSSTTSAVAAAADGDTLVWVCSEFARLLSTMRVQDEHYVRHPKLFSARLLESHEVSIVPTASSSIASNVSLSQVRQVESPLLTAGGSDLGVINGSRRFSTAPFPFPTRASGSSNFGSSTKHGHTSSTASSTPLSRHKSTEVLPESDNLADVSDFAMARASLGSLVALLLARLATEYGALLFSPNDMTVFTHNPYALAENEVIKSMQVRPLPSPKDQQGVESPRAGPSSTPSKASIAPTSSVASASHWRKFRDLLGAYDTWNRLAAQLIHTGIVQSRGLLNPGARVEKAEGAGSTLGGTVETLESPAPVMTPNNTGVSTSSVDTDVSDAPLSLSIDTMTAALRPKLLHQLELLPHSALVATANSNHRTGGPPGRHTSVSGGTSIDRLEQAAAAATRIRRLGASTDAAVMLARVGALHETVLAAAEQQCDFRLARQQLRDLQQLQWSQACQLAAPSSVSLQPPSGASECSAASATANANSDPRPDLFECITFDNGIMARLLSVEREPGQELLRVRAIMEKKQLAFRQLYARHRATSAYALSLDELWHVVKLLRLPREVHALAPPAPSQLNQRQVQHAGEDDDDDELIFSTGPHASGANQYHEQLFSPEDLAEVLLLLCNEQFPSLPLLSARVEHFAANHLPFAANNAANSSSARSRFFSGGVRDLLLQPDVNRALNDHAQTLRVIFRRYCAKERDVQVTTTAAALATAIEPMALMPGAIVGGGGRSPVMLRGARAKFMRLNDWLAFVQDYHLLRARFTLERAIGVFRGVLGQDLAQRQADDKDASAHEAADRALEMAYGAFCEAVAAMALCFAPDPFAKTAAKISQFVSRFLPVAPEEAHDHALLPVAIAK